MQRQLSMSSWDCITPNRLKDEMLTPLRFQGNHFTLKAALLLVRQAGGQGGRIVRQSLLIIIYFLTI